MIEKRKIPHPFALIRLKYGLGHTDTLSMNDDIWESSVGDERLMGAVLEYFSLRLKGKAPYAKSVAAKSVIKTNDVVII